MTRVVLHRLLAAVALLAGLSFTAGAQIPRLPGARGAIPQQPVRRDITQDSTKFKIGSQMPAYTLGITAVSVSFDPTAKQAVATVNWTIADHPSGSTNVLKASASAKQPGTIKPPSDSDKGQLLIDAAEAATDAAIKHLLQKHPRRRAAGSASHCF